MLASPLGIDGREVFQQSFNFSKFPNLQEVAFGVGWVSGGLRWIPMALSTIKPATSPRLSAIRLDFVYPYTFDRHIDTLIVGAGDDLRWIADEAPRIKREFEGAVNLTVLRDASFKAAFDALNVRFIP